MGDDGIDFTEPDEGDISPEELGDELGEDITSDEVDAATDAADDVEKDLTESASADADQSVDDIVDEAKSADPEVGDKMDDEVEKDGGKSIGDKVKGLMEQFPKLTSMLGYAAAGLLMYSALTGKSPAEAFKGVAKMAKGIWTACSKFASSVMKAVTDVFNFFIKFWWVFAILGGIFGLIWLKTELFPGGFGGGGGGGGGKIEYIQQPEPQVQYVQGPPPSYAFGGKKRGGRRVSKFKH